MYIRYREHAGLRWVSVDACGWLDLRENVCQAGRSGSTIVCLGVAPSPRVWRGVGASKGGGNSAAPNTDWLCKVRCSSSLWIGRFVGASVLATTHSSLALERIFVGFTAVMRLTPPPPTLIFSLALCFGTRKNSGKQHISSSRDGLVLFLGPTSPRLGSNWLSQVRFRKGGSPWVIQSKEECKQHFVRVGGTNAIRYSAFAW